MKYLAPVFAVLLVVSVLLASASKAAPAPLATETACGSIDMTFAKIGGADAFYLIVKHTHGAQWYMVHGPSASLTYKGCFLYEQPNTIVGPYTGDIDITFFADPAIMGGNWQIVVDTGDFVATSNAVALP